MRIRDSEEWLIDRKRIPSDWRKRLAALKVRITKELLSLPKDADPYFHTLDPEGWIQLFNSFKPIIIV